MPYYSIIGPNHFVNYNGEWGFPYYFNGTFPTPTILMVMVGMPTGFSAAAPYNSMSPGKYSGRKAQAQFGFLILVWPAIQFQ
jgi:hypothetical protein